MSQRVVQPLVHRWRYFTICHHKSIKNEEISVWKSRRAIERPGATLCSLENYGGVNTAGGISVVP